MAEKNYVVERTAPTIYQDKTGQIVNGYQVTVYFPEFEETHFIQVPTLEPEKVKIAIAQVLEYRKKLAAL